MIVKVADQSSSHCEVKGAGRTEVAHCMYKVPGLLLLFCVQHRVAQLNESFRLSCCKHTTHACIHTYTHNFSGIWNVVVKTHLYKQSPIFHSLASPSLIMVISSTLPVAALDSRCPNNSFLSSPPSLTEVIWS